MQVKNPFSRFRASGTPSSPRTVFATSKQRHLDRKLVQQTRVRYIPSWKQLTYVSRFLSNSEKRIIRLLSVAIVLCTTALVVFFVAQHTETVPTNGGEYSEGFIGQPKFLNPLFSSTSEIDSDATALLYAGLFTYNDKREIVPDLAERYATSDDHKIYDITIHTDRSWSDGTPLTIDDVLFTFQTIQNPEVGSPLAASFQGVSIEKKDEKTIRFTLKQPFSPFIHTLTVGIIPEHIWGKIDNPAHLRLAKTNLEPVGNGRWQFDRLIKREGGGIELLSLKPNPYYHGLAPRIQKFAMHFFADQTSLLDALITRRIHAISFPPRSSTSSVTGLSNNMRSYSVELPQYTALFFNSDIHPLLKDKNLRRALAAAVPRQELISSTLGSSALEINGPILPGMIGYNPNRTGNTTTLDEANLLLDKTWDRIQPEAYFAFRTEELRKERGTLDPKTKKVTTTPDIDATIMTDIQKEMSPTQTFYRRNKKGSLLRTTITTVDTPEYQRVATFIATAWQSVGMQTTVKPISRQFFLRNVIKNRDYDAVLYGEILGGDPDPFPFWHSSQVNYPGLNLSLYSDKTVDSLLENARTTTSTTERAALYDKFQQILDNDVPALFLYSPRYEFLASTEIKNVSIPPLTTPSQRYMNFAHWYIKTDWRWKK